MKYSTVHYIKFILVSVKHMEWGELWCGLGNQEWAVLDKELVCVHTSNRVV
jgi:hypothetical protein